MTGPSASPPRPLRGRYQIYKQKTREVVEWLIIHAGPCDASALSATNQTHSSAGDRNILKIKVRALVSLAESVKSRQMPIPPAILKDLALVVEYRREFASWYATQDDSEQTASNERHQYFVAICEEVHQLLSSVDVPVAAAKKKGKGAGLSAAVDTNTLEKTVRNLFAQLEVDEPSESPLGNAPKTKAQHSEAAARIELDTNDREEHIFEIWCFLQDMYDVREFITQTWRSYASGDVSTLAATLVLEVGLMLLQSAHDEFVQAHPDCSNWYSIAGLLSIGTKSLGSGTTYVYPLHMGIGSECVPRHTSNRLANLLCPGAANAMRVTHESVQNIISNLETWSTPLPRSKEENFSFAELVEQSSLEIYFLAESRGQGSALSRLAEKESQFIAGLTKYCAGPAEALPAWMVMAFETYCNIFEIIGSSPDLAHRTYLDEMASWDGRIQEYRDFLKPSGITVRERTGPWSVDLDSVLRMYAEQTSYRRLPDGRHSMSESHYESKKMRCISQLLPCSTARTMFSSVYVFHKAGLWITRDYLQVVIMAHLYTAMRRYGILNSAWHDMDLVLAQQKSVQPLFPKLSSNPFGMVKHLLLALGTPATSFASGKIPKPPSETVIGPACRKLGEPSLLIENMERRRQQQPYCSTQQLYEVVLTTMTEKKSAKLPGKKARNCHEDIRFTPVELLSTFKESFISEEPQLNFNYFGFWMCCQSMYTTMLGDAKIVKDLLSKVSKPGDLELCYIVVYHLLLSAAFAVANDKPVENLPINSAAALMEDFISTNGNKFSQAAFRVSSGRIPKENRPELRKWEPTAPSDVASILSQDPAATYVNTPSYETIYDPNGSEERFAIAAKYAEAIDYLRCSEGETNRRPF